MSEIPPPNDGDNSTISELRATISNKNREISAKDSELATHKATIAERDSTLAQRDTKIAELTPLQTQLETMKSEFETEKAELTGKVSKAELAEQYEADLTALFDKQLALVPEAQKEKVIALIGNASIREKFSKLESAMELIGIKAEIKLGGAGGAGASGPGTGVAGAFDPKNPPSWSQALSQRQA